MNRIQLLFFILSLAYCASSVGQQDTIPLEYYFDDKGLSESNYAYKVDLGSVAFGDVAFTAERKMGSLTSFEIGGGFLLKNALIIDEPAHGELSTNERDGGYSFSLAIRYYHKGRAIKGLYLAPQFKQRVYYHTNDNIFYRKSQTVRQNDFTAQLGYQYVKGHLVLDANIGAGYRDVKFNVGNLGNEIKDNGLGGQLSVKVGFTL